MTLYRRTIVVLLDGARPEVLQFNYHLAPRKKLYSSASPAGRTSTTWSPADWTRRTDLTRHTKLRLYTYAHFTAKCRPADRAARHHLLAGVAANPEFVFAVFPGVDAFTHLSHPRAAEVRHAYHVVEEALGAFFELLRQHHWLRDSLVFVISDQGLSQTHTHFDTVAFLDRQGFKAMHCPSSFARSRKQP